MRDLGGPVGATAADARLERYAAAYDRQGLCRWALESLDGEFLGYVGVMQVGPEHPLGRHHDIGWRLVRRAWGRGYATESAVAALRDAFMRVGPPEVLAYTAADNRRSQAVMRRLGLRRDPGRDFEVVHPCVGAWRGMVSTAQRALWDPLPAGRGEPPRSRRACRARP